MQYGPNKQIILPDAVSWQPAPPANVRPNSNASLPSVVLEPSWLAKVYKGQQSELTLGPFLEKSKATDLELVLQQVHGLSLLYQHPKAETYQLVIFDGQDLHRILMEDAHSTPLAGHICTHKVISALQQRVQWPRLTLDVRTFIGGCLVYKGAKDSTYLPAGQL